MGGLGYCTCKNCSIDGEWTKEYAFKNINLWMQRKEHTVESIYKVFMMMGWDTTELMNIKLGVKNEA